ncbi:Imm64 family immunity protein [Ruminiclostridium cellulolyticum]|uniref:Uncharacterized protein n=1 Tax=Ruminiclostridium cellulolyticum (strain ATCC 35319 / DSM 5812 / JCM 6584 / H10) TaxID=394503 RepID=B8I7J1_RUMCH|nr:Imm64 family immunity protein [Ruminiclostridium cellulolyticum]ACL77062.1 conserved hypothetical protein [Ruminiclostridium cellulolyticum H10]
MGSYIGIGFVYNGMSGERVEIELKNIVNFLISHNGNINSIKFSKDEYGNVWIQDSLNNKCIDDFYSSLCNGYFGELHITCSILSVQNLNVCIRIEKAKKYFGLLLDISEEELIGVNSSENINRITEEIIEFFNELYKASVFEYAICDNEAEIQYSPEEFQSIGEAVYSIAALPEKNKKSLKIIKNSWHIDGLTAR